MSRWLNSYLEVNRLWSDRQHGYRQHRSTSTALLQLQEEILNRHEEGSDVAMLCFDSSAAFDTLTHTILLKKLSLYSCSEHVSKWFTSYLSDRWQCFPLRLGKKTWRGRRDSPMSQSYRTCRKPWETSNISLQDLFPSVRSKYNKNNIIIYNKKAAMYLTIG